jgi:uncharacterized protein
MDQIRGVAAALLIILPALASCRHADKLEPRQLTAAEALGETGPEAVCHEPGARGTPLVVDWPTQDRMDLEAAMLDGIGVVEYRCGKLLLLHDCHIEGSYRYLGLSQREEVIQLEDAAEIRANLPLQGASIVAKLGAELERGRALDLAMIHSGKLRTTVAAATREQLQGRCENATHLIRGAFVGAFAMAQGTRGRIGAVAEIFEAGLRAQSSSQSELGRRDGDPDRCKGVQPGTTEPPAQCTAPIRLELVAIGDASTESVATPPALEAEMACPEGMVVSGEKCMTEKTSPYRCSGMDAKECQEQCEAGEPSSCAILGTMYEGGHGVSRDAALAAAWHDQGCGKGVAYSCSRLGVMFFYGNGVDKDPRLAAELFHHACSHGDGDGCNNLGMVNILGSGVERNLALGTKLLSWACNAGDVQGCFNAMVAYREGWGVSRDQAIAKEFGESARLGGIVPGFERGCAGGNAYTCWGLGYMHQHGIFKPRDPGQAKLFYQKSCPGFEMGCEFSASLE